MTANDGTGYTRYPTRATVEANGYTWNIYGGAKNGRWQCHLVEMAGSLAYDGQMDNQLRNNLRGALAKALNIPYTQIMRITRDVIAA